MIGFRARPARDPVAPIRYRFKPAQVTFVRIA